MEDFTTDQIAGIAAGYNNMARVLNEYQLAHWSDLSHEQQLDVNAYQNSLLNRAHDLRERITKPAFTNVADMAFTIQKATFNAQANLKYIKSLTTALALGAMVVALASYVARANTQGIKTILRELGELLEREEMIKS